MGSIGIVIRLRDGQLRNLSSILSRSTASGQVLGLTQPPIELVLGDAPGGINHDHPTLYISFVAPFIIVSSNLVWCFITSTVGT